MGIGLLIARAIILADMDSRALLERERSGYLFDANHIQIPAMLPTDVSGIPVTNVNFTHAPMA